MKRRAKQFRVPKIELKPAMALQHTQLNLWKLFLKNLGVNSAKQPTKSSLLVATDESLELITNMVKLPFYLERFMLFGLLSCVCAFLKLLVIVPVKLAIDVVRLIIQFRNNFITNQRHRLAVAGKVNYSNLLFVALLSSASWFLSSVDTSRIYHTIKIQSSIKLYVIFGVLEITDKLLSTIGQDLLNILFNRSINSLQTVIIFIMSFGYLYLHTLVLIYQTVSLNVAANSYSNLLITLLFSNQFAEIKSSVFKKIDKEGLFQISCADIVERFQLFIMLLIITLRNIVQMNNKNKHQLLPNSSLSFFKGANLGMIIGPTTIVIGSELIVDWIKHSYVTKFNKIKPQIYSRYLNILSTDILDDFKDSSNDNVNSINDRIQHRLGLPLSAIFILFILMSKRFITWLLFLEDSSGSLINRINYKNGLIIVVSGLSLLMFTLVLELILIKWSTSIIKHYNNSSEVEQIYTSGLLDGLSEKDRSKLYPPSEIIPPNRNDVRKEKDSRHPLSLNSVSRYRMSSKNIW